MNLATPLDRGLLMANDELVTVRDILGLGLHSMRLVVLTACNSATSGSTTPDEAVSLPASLLAAGTQRVVAALWPVFDVVSPVLMYRFYEGWIIEGLAPHEALRQAQRWVRDVTNAELATLFPESPIYRGPGTLGETAVRFWERARPYADPVIWASFIYTGL